jgi:hypothetical protein
VKGAAWPSCASDTYLDGMDRLYPDKIQPIARVAMPKIVHTTVAQTPVTTPASLEAKIAFHQQANRNLAEEPNAAVVTLPTGKDRIAAIRAALLRDKARGNP